MGSFRKSSFSQGNGACVEVADQPDGGRLVRDSKSGEGGPVLAFTPEEWSAFLSGVRAGEFG